MANYNAFFRSNYFRVQDEATFLEWCELLELTFIRNDTNPGLVGFLGDEVEGGIPYSLWNEETQDWVDLDFASELATHLVDGEVAVVIEIGQEKYRYLVGTALAVNANGKTHEITLNQIYALAQQLGSNVTEAEY